MAWCTSRSLAIACRNRKTSRKERSRSLLENIRHKPTTSQRNTTKKRLVKHAPYKNQCPEGQALPRATSLAPSSRDATPSAWEGRVKRSTSPGKRVALSARPPRTLNPPKPRRSPACPGSWSSVRPTLPRSGSRTWPRRRR